MNKWSKNNKLNKVLTFIEEELKNVGIEEIKRYMKEFPNEIDYNIAQYGNVSIYYYDIQELYKNCGYKTKFSDNEIWEIYKRQVGYVARKLVK